MKLAILSDFHFGFASGTEREDDPFEAASEAIDKALSADLILVPGDIFDVKVPSTETLARAMEIFTKPILSRAGVELYKTIKKSRKEISEKSLLGTPVIAIHGTHERRIKGLMNPVQALEKAGFAVYLHCNGVVFEKEGEKVCIQGMSGVPDQYAESVLKEWNPKPVPDCFNILMLHQSVKEFMHENVPHAMPLEKIPPGFDLYILGHIHRPEVSSHAGSALIVSGSLIRTQLRKNMEKLKGLWFFDTKDAKPRFVPLENQRKFYCIEAEGKNLKETETEIENTLQGHHRKKPIIRIDTSLDYSEINRLKTKFEDRALLYFRKKTTGEERPEAKSLEEHRLSVEKLGKKLLRENLEQAKLNPRLFEEIFELLLEKKQDDALEILEKGLNEIRPGQKEKRQPAEKAKKEIKPPETKKEGRGLEKFLGD